eukprot:3225521-Rhodomonas_salina.1
MEGAGMSSEDEHSVIVQLVGGEGSNVDDEIEPVAVAAVDPPSTENLENPISAGRGRGAVRGRGRGRTLGLTGARAARAAAAAAKAPQDHK